eukprot:m51a1_g2316 hypothetical protein (205) ;mRNA; r:484408-485209
MPLDGRQRAALQKLIRKQCDQVDHFERWAEEHKWLTFHKSHFDWWVFPTDEPSSKRSESQNANTRGSQDKGKADEYVLTKDMVAEVRENEDEYADLLYSVERAVELVCRAWGWEVLDARESTMPEVEAGQRWDNWPVRLYRMGVVCLLLGRLDLYRSLRTYAETLSRRGQSLDFHSPSTGLPEHVLRRWDERIKELFGSAGLPR